ncbi:hypothetical protein ACWCP8_37235 [Streptomyces sp. NPDC002206]
MPGAAERAGAATVWPVTGSRRIRGFGEAEPFDRDIGDHTAVDIPLHYKAGDMMA